MDKAPLTFRMAERKDAPLILQFIRELARYEKLEQEVVATESLLEEWIFDKGKAEVLFALAGGKEVGFALFFHNFSTFLGRAGLYLEDLYVMPEYRGQGYGKTRLKAWFYRRSGGGERSVLRQKKVLTREGKTRIIRVTKSIYIF